MQSKLCLVLALVVLLGALAFGNPFRGDGPAVSLRAGGGAAAPVAERVAVAPAAEVSLAANLPAKRAAGLEDAAMPGAHLASLPSGPVPAVQRSELGGKRSKRPPAAAAEPKDAVAAEVCPDAALQPLVVRVRKGADGQMIWVLRDGRQVRRNPKTGPGEPLVVPVGVPAGAGVGQAEQADEGADR